MSELRIALIAEGTTDYELIHAALRAMLRRPFILTTLQPEATRPLFGQGWGGVLKWCHQVARSGSASLDSYPPLDGFDLAIIHADADVVSKSYDDCGREISILASSEGWESLPCDLGLEDRLATLRLDERIKKSAAQYKAKAAQVTKNWDKV